MRRLHSIAIADWPLQDRRAWAAALIKVGPFDEGGVASEWRPATRRAAITGYGYWLKFLADQSPDLLNLHSAERATDDRLRIFAQMLLGRISAMGAAAALGHLVLALRAIAPCYDLTELHAIHNAVQRNARPKDKRAKLTSTERLVGLGWRLMRDAERDGAVRDLRAYRDGLLIALLAARPLRLGSIARLRVDRHVEAHGHHIVLAIPGGETKNRQPIECWLPDDLVPFFQRYLQDVRPRFYYVDRHQGLWPSSKGNALTPAGIYQIIIRRTGAAFDQPIHPHLFRDIAATTLAIESPEQALLARDLLNHSDFRMTENHYLHAKTVEAGHAYAKTRALRSKQLSSGITQ